METAAKVAAIAVVTAILCVLLRENGKPLSLVLSLLVCVGILVLGLRFLSPVWVVLEQLKRLSGLSDAVTAPLLKVTGIGILTQVAGGVCADAGETSLTKAVELTGSFLALYAAIPLLSSVLELLEQLLGGS